MKCDTESRAFKLTKHDVAALAEFASTDKTRTTLTCIRFEPDAGTAVATDGHTLVAAKNGGTYAGEPFLAPAKALVEMAKLLKKDDVLTIERKATEALAEVIITAPNGATSRLACEDDHFPAWRQVMPEASASATNKIAFNMKYIARLEAVQKAAETRGGTFIVPESDMAPIAVTFKGFDATWTAVIMPMRV